MRSEPEQAVVIVPPAAPEAPKEGRELGRRWMTADGLEVREFDVNGDGRPDIVRYFKGGKLVREDIDLNFDGMPDVRNFYEGGKLIRRELDLDGDGRMDKVETHP
jgi:hypothetical protein